MNELFLILGDLHLTTMKNYKDDQNIYLCSYAVVEIVNDGRSFKDYGWDQTCTTFLVKFKNGQIVEFNRPTLYVDSDGNYDPIINNLSNEEKIVNYDCSKFFSVCMEKYRICEYYPAIISLNNDSNILKMLTARVCVSNNNGESIPNQCS